MWLRMPASDVVGQCNSCSQNWRLACAVLRTRDLCPALMRCLWPSSLSIEIPRLPQKSLLSSQLGHIPLFSIKQCLTEGLPASVSFPFKQSGFATQGRTTCQQEANLGARAAQSGVKLEDLM